MRLLILAALLPVTTACHASWEKDPRTVTPTGAGATRDFAASGFTAIDLRGPDDVEVRAGPSFSVRAEGDSAVLDQLKIEVVGDTLRVGRKNLHGLSFSSDHGAKIYVTLPALRGALVSGSGDLQVDRAGGDFNGSVAGSGNLSVAALDARQTQLSLAGSGDMTLAGKAGQLSANITGSGDVEADKLVATGADVSVTGSGSLKAAVKGNASVSLVGSGDVELTSGAKCTVHSVGSGEVRCS